MKHLVNVFLCVPAYAFVMIGSALVYIMLTKRDGAKETNEHAYPKKISFYRHHIIYITNVLCAPGFMTSRSCMSTVSSASETNNRLCTGIVVVLVSYSSTYVFWLSNEGSTKKQTFRSWRRDFTKNAPKKRGKSGSPNSRLLRTHMLYTGTQFGSE